MKAPNVGKWSKHQHLAKDARLQAYLPPTKRFSPADLWEYMENYGDVILKPSGGGGGAGIIKMSSLDGERYRIHAGSIRRVVEGKEAVLHALKSLFRPKIYLLQPHLSLGRINGRPFDVRVMVQRTRSNQPWQVTGWLAKLAGPGYVVTNVARSRGSVLSLQNAIQRSGIPKRPDLLFDIKKVSLAVASCLGKAYPRLLEIGLDLGLDQEGKIWVIEANFRPALSLFQRLPEKTFYRRIKAFRIRK
ncbi:YheC/YheD family protein [Brevibacillus panacihumi]|uniref:YheC/YheD family protein n=1 Tax=Brevibacillus panacihumi TaxID=497735 RepID=UPI003D1F4EF5